MIFPSRALHSVTARHQALRALRVASRAEVCAEVCAEVLLCDAGGVLSRRTSHARWKGTCVLRSGGTSCKRRRGPFGGRGAWAPATSAAQAQGLDITEERGSNVGAPPTLLSARDPLLVLEARRGPSSTAPRLCSRPCRGQAKGTGRRRGTRLVAVSLSRIPLSSPVGLSRDPAEPPMAVLRMPRRSVPAQVLGPTGRRVLAPAGTGSPRSPRFVIRQTRELDSNGACDVLSEQSPKKPHRNSESGMFSLSIDKGVIGLSRFS